MPSLCLYKYMYYRMTEYYPFPEHTSGSCDLPNYGLGEGEEVRPGGGVGQEGAFQEGAEHQGTSPAAATVAWHLGEAEGGLEGKTRGRSRTGQVKASLVAQYQASCFS